jgi:cystathionine gamma-lyase
VVYSITKYMNGHSDVLMGAIVLNRDDLKQRIAFLQNSLGAVPSPFDCYLVLRSLRTLHVRMPLHMKNAFAVATFLSTHPKVEKVLHPGLKSHPQHELALKQTSGHSGLISFYIKKNGSGDKFLQNLKIFSLAESLGGYESLAELPYVNKATIYCIHNTIIIEMKLLQIFHDPCICSCGLARKIGNHRRLYSNFCWA